MSIPPPRSLHDLGFAAIEEELRASGVSAHHAKALWRALHRENELDLASRDFSPPLKQWVVDHVGEGKSFFLDAPAVSSETHSSDGLTRKFLLRQRDGQETETVLMGYDGRHTACVSTQAGCAMGCVFCATGQMGFVRHLRPGEIVAQVLHARRVLAATMPGRRLRNLVLMGMGEPLHNYDSVIQALDIISTVRGISIGPSRISIAARLDKGTLIRSGVVTRMLRIDSMSSRKRDGSRTTAANRRSPSKTSVASRPPNAVSIRSLMSATFTP